jgi:selenocysteine lyase/cysteine desulfurase
MIETASLEWKEIARGASGGMAQHAFRDFFPVLSDLTHAASCSQGALSAQVLAALHEYTWSLRAKAAPWDAWMGQVDLARARFAGLIGAAPEQIAVVSCASEAAFQAASSLAWTDRPGLVTTEAEFPSIAHVWLGQKVNGAAVEFVPGAEMATAEGYARHVTERTHLVSVPMAGFRNGARFPVADVASLAHRSGARVFVDAYQAAGVMPVNVRELDCDYLVAGALKYLLGMPGAAFLYVREGIDHERDPQLTGWFGRTDPYSFDPRTLDFPAKASRFEIGTPAIPSFYAAAAGLKLVSAVDMAQSFAHVAALTAELTARLEEAGETLASPACADRRGAQVALRDPDADRLASWLSERRIVTAPRGAVLRISFHYYNDMGDVAAIADAIREYRRNAPGS